MRTHELAIANYQSPEAVVRFLDEHKVKRGDTLKVTTEQYQQTILMALSLIVVMALFYFYKKKGEREEEGGKILEGIFKEGATVEDIEKQVEKEYGIKIEVETKPDEERDFWYKLSAQNLSRAYGIDESDYSDVTILEPNPNYKPWKEDKS
jgi:hypothetical protein